MPAPAAVDHLAAPAVAVPREAGLGGIERFHVEDGDHPLERQLGQGRTPVNVPLPIVTRTSSWSNAT